LLSSWITHKKNIKLGDGLCFFRISLILRTDDKCLSSYYIGESLLYFIYTASRLLHFFFLSLTLSLSRFSNDSLSFCNLIHNTNFYSSSLSLSFYSLPFSFASYFLAALELWKMLESVVIVKLRKKKYSYKIENERRKVYWLRNGFEWKCSELRWVCTCVKVFLTLLQLFQCHESVCEEKT
jgi:hypothetical protein